MPRQERVSNTELRQIGRRPTRSDGPYAPHIETEALVVGGGFGGIYSLYLLRKSAIKTVMFEAGTGYGGTWRHNVYPGARVDSPVPIYELAIPELYETFTWSTNYPDWRELQKYFDHCDKILDLSKDTAFETVVTSARFDTDDGCWNVTTADGRTATCRFLVVAAGFAAKRYVPDFEGLDSFRGEIHHSSFWPSEGVDWKGKRVAVIGTGASGVQIVSEMASEASQLTVFQRTPNLALPMRRKLLTEEEQERTKSCYPWIYELREKTFAGFQYDLVERKTWQDTPKERRELWERLWEEGGFKLWLGGYIDYLFDAEANRQVYDFWREKQSDRVKDKVKRDILFPKEPFHAFGIKRPCLEQNFYEALDQENVEVVNLRSTPIDRFTEKGIVTRDGNKREFDIIALATGFDIVTGGMTQMGLTSLDGMTLNDEWKTGAITYLGVTLPNYPNCFHMYGPHGPTLLSNGPSSVDVQARWIRDAINKILREGIKYINPTKKASDSWKKRINDLADATLFPTTSSTYMGSSIPGKKHEMTCYAGGLHNYGPEIRAALPNWSGFEVVRK